MPLFLNEKKDKFSFAVWQINEDLSFFLDRISLSVSEKEEIKDFKSNRLLEWVAARYLISIIENKKTRSYCLKDKYGKPYLNNSNFYISLSHSGNLISAVISSSLVGIDIQKISDKVEIIKHKFLSKDELSDCDNDLKCYNRVWTAKEAIYKAYGKKNLRFIENIKTNKFISEFHYHKSTGRISKGDVHIEYELWSKLIEGSILTIALKI